MCRMLIAIGEVNVPLLIEGAIRMARDVNSTHELNEKQGPGSWKHGDGWGAAYLDSNNKWVVKKSTKPIYDDPEIEELRKIKTNLLIIHTRYKMGSEISIDNTHPFVFERNKRDTFIFCHNGFIEEEIYFDKKYKAKGDTDSERLFYSILTDLRKSNTVKAIRKNFNRYRKLKGTNIILSDKDDTVVAMRENQFPIYYQMSLGRTKNMIIVSSEPFKTIPGIFWELLHQGDIIKINHKTLKTMVNKEKNSVIQKITGLYSAVSKKVKKNKTNLITYYNSKGIFDGN